MLLEIRIVIALLGMDREVIIDYKGTQGTFWSAENVLHTFYGWQAHKYKHKSKFIKLYT